MSFILITSSNRCQIIQVTSGGQRSPLKKVCESQKSCLFVVDKILIFHFCNFDELSLLSSHTDFMLALIMILSVKCESRTHTILFTLFTLSYFIWSFPAAVFSINMNNSSINVSAGTDTSEDRALKHYPLLSPSPLLFSVGWKDCWTNGFGRRSTGCRRGSPGRT